MFMETLAAIMILVPVMLPVAYSVGIDPIHFGIVMICTLSVGFITPPLGENLFIASGISKLDYEVIAAKALPFMGALAISAPWMPSRVVAAMSSRTWRLISISGLVMVLPSGAPERGGAPPLSE